MTCFYNIKQENVQSLYTNIHYFTNHRNKDMEVLVTFFIYIITYLMSKFCILISHLSKMFIF